MWHKNRKYCKIKKKQITGLQVLKHSPCTIDLYWLTSMTPSAPSSVSGVLGGLRLGLGVLEPWLLSKELYRASCGVSWRAADLLIRLEPGRGLEGVLEGGTREGREVGIAMGSFWTGLLGLGLPGSTWTCTAGSGSFRAFCCIFTWLCWWGGSRANSGVHCSCIVTERWI